MKILRKHKGFTTNSSSAFEFVPIEGTTGGNASAPTGKPVIAVNPFQTATPQPAAGLFSGKHPLVNIGFLALCIFCLFVIEELIRRIWKRLKSRRQDE